MNMTLRLLFGSVLFFAASTASAQSMHFEKSPFGGFDRVEEGVSATVMRLGDVTIRNDGLLTVTPTPTFSIKTGARATATWKFTMDLASFGRDQVAEQLPQSSRSTLDWNRLEHHFGPVVLRYDHLTTGLEQSVVVSQRPGGEGDLRVSFQMSPAFEYRSVDDRSFDVFSNDRLAIQFTKLLAFDATGRELTARIEIVDHVAHYVVDDRDAQYPILIDPLATTPNLTLDEGGNGNKYGWTATSVGDVNNDTYNDLIIGEIRYSNGETNEGRALIHYGSANGIEATSSWAVESDAASFNFGRSAALVGDVNGDDYPDFLVGATFGGPGFEGEAYLFLGDDAPQTTPIWSKAGATIEAYGEYLTGAGDLNCDGIPDIAIAGFLHDVAPGTDNGRVEIFYGLAAAPYYPAVADLEIIGAESAGRFGQGISSAGNLNGDTEGGNACDDLLIAAPNFNGGGAAGNSEGRVNLYYGSSAGMSPTEAWFAEGNAANTQLGFSVHGGYDVNNDGYTDIVAGGFGGVNTNGDPLAGRVDLYLGSATVPSATPDWQIEGEQANGFFGRAARFAGDLDNNGFVDIVVGSDGYTVNVAGEGAAFGFMNGNGIPETVADWRETEGASSQFGVRLNPLGDVNGDGFDDLVVSADIAFGSNDDAPGAVYVYHGVQTCTIAGEVYGDGVGEVGNLCRVCDIAQSTTDWVQAAEGTSCGPQTCAGNDLSGDACDAAGACVPGAVFSCSPYSCDAGADVCFASCTIDDDCADGVTCVNAICVVEPTAIVTGPDSAACETSVTLDGSTSVDPGGATLSYAWAQTDGADVLTGVATDAATLTFTTPRALAGDTLTFELVVDNGTFNNTAAFSVTVDACPNPTDDMGVSDVGTDTGADGGGPDPKVSGGGCGDCATAPTDGPGSMLLALLLLGLLRVRRRRS